ncbi:M20/M25/M40 family metallo-hydrolase [Emticicia sp. 21SJ11W-3]|uniref:M20/M25/M40 family metallo-hydrolase n=1 Tax=Emticicia sp. 21SJ11W-3 TaxID=2916755 RepID=UPI00209FE8EE|nr:M20/M25/M40 family metallo-hydrolase [Emticicia sp. 21SJ11W-3]UTA66659.1 M20/M25/M40 family metallo-hydrolase [Emticicia sp. 21SJ11W-3]
MSTNLLIALSAFLCFFNGFVQAQNPADSVVLRKIRAAAETNRLQQIVTTLADINGPRLSGTRNYYESARWAKQELASYGVDSTWFESFDEKYRGWQVKSFNIELTSPTYMHLIAYPLAYTQSTKGTVSGEAIIVNHIDSLPKLKGTLRGKVLLLAQDFRSFNASTQILSERLSKETLQQAADNPDPNDLMIGYHSRRSTNQAIENQEAARSNLKDFFTFCEKEGVLALIEPSDYPYGILHADGNHHVPSYRHLTEIKPIASFVVANEHFGRIVRLIKAGEKPMLKLNLQTEFNYNPEYNVNVIADMKGHDPALAQQQVIIGAHLDSWHAGTGAVDNAAGCAVMMEAIRLLKVAGLQPRRTIKIGLWGGEEQVFAGSRKYVETHVGSLTDGKPQKDFSHISAYFNLDNGTGKIRGIYAQGNSKAKPILEQYLHPFNAAGNGTVTLQNANQTDHELFDALNIPAFQFIQDPLNYISAVHHTTMDVREYVNFKDLKESAIIVAYIAYKTAMADDLLPRRDHISILPSTEGNTTFFLKGFETARAVSIVSDFNNWNMFGTPLAKVPGGWQCKLNLQPGRYLFKYIVDGDWTADPNTPTNQLLRDGKGHAGLTEVIVK